MKKIFYALGIILLTVVMALGLYVICGSFVSTEPVNIEVECKSHIIYDGVTLNITEEEQGFLEKSLQNKNVLILFAETDKTESKEKAEFLVKGYSSKVDIPYIVFFYNTVEKRLTSISNEYVEFDNINVSNAEYTEVYRYIPIIKSNKMISIAKQNIDGILMLLLMCLGSILFIIKFIKKLVKEIKWIVEDDFRYKNVKDGVKVKFNKDNGHVKEIWTNGEIKKDYIFIPNYNPYVMDGDNYKFIRVIHNSGEIIHYYCDYSNCEDMYTIAPASFAKEYEPKFKYVLKYNKS